MSVSDELEKLSQLHQTGVLNDEEFATAKAKLLNSPSRPAGVAGTDLAQLEEQTNFWAFALHLSVLASFVVPIAGIVVPIVIWQLKKDELPGIDIHGKNAVNWIISEFIYAIGCVILIIVVIGLPLLIALGVIGTIFPIIAAIKARKGEVWKYPLTITFLH